MPEIPQEAIDDAVDAWHEAPRNEHEAIALDDLMRHVLEAAAPYIAAQALIGERRRAPTRGPAQRGPRRPHGTYAEQWENEDA